LSGCGRFVGAGVSFGRFPGGVVVADGGVTTAAGFGDGVVITAAVAEGDGRDSTEAGDIACRSSLAAPSER
jgi:hypothetical protein